MRGRLQGDQYVKYEDEDNKLRMAGGSWSINLDFLPEAADTIVYKTRLRDYAISRSDAFTHGFVKQMGSEQKLIVPLTYWWIE